MAGIYDRIKPDATDRLAVHRMMAALVLYSSGMINSTQARTVLNEVLQSPLSGAEITDLLNIVAQIDAKTGTANKLAYVHQVESVSIIAERGSSLMSEAVFKNLLGI